MTQKLLITGILLLINSGLFAQQICGRVVENDGVTPVEFAQVLVVHSTNGSVTDVKGNFCVPGSSSGSLEVSHIGYETVWVPIGQQTFYIIKLVRSTSMFPTVIIQPEFILRDSFFSVGTGTSISARHLKQLNYTDINRIVSSVAGVNVQEEDGFGLRPNIGMRGSGSTRSSKITLMEDGILISPAPYAAAAAYYFPTMGRMQGIEILKGTAQIPYGPNTTGGAVNLISAQFTKGPSAQLWMEAGSFGTSVTHARYSNHSKGFSYLAEYFRYASDGFKTLDGPFNSGFDKSDYLIKLGYQWGEKWKQNIQAKLSKTDEVSNESYLGVTLSDFNKAPYHRYSASQIDQFEGRHEHMSLRYSAISRTGFEISVVAYRSLFHRNWYKLDKAVDTSGKAVGIASVVASEDGYPFLLGVLRGQNDLAGGLQVKANNRDYYSEGVQANFGYRIGKGSGRQYIHGGVRLHRDGLDRFQWTDVYSMNSGRMIATSFGVPGTESNLLLDAKAISGFAQYDISAGKWQLNPGIRYEHIRIEELNFGKKDPERTGKDEVDRNNGNQVVLPGMGFKRKFGSSWSMMGGIHRGFTPSSVDSGALPELSINGEMGFQLNRAGYSVKAVAFHTGYDNLLTTDAASTGGSGSTKTYNGGKAQSYGLELEGGFVAYTNTTVNVKVPVQLTYTFTQSEFLSNFNSTFEGWGTIKKGDEVPYVAKHQVNLLLSMFSRYGMLTFNNRLTGPVRTIAGQGALTETNSIGTIFLTDLNFQFNVNPSTRLLLGINNLWNNSYLASAWPAGYRPGMPRYVHGGVRFSL